MIEIQSVLAMRKTQPWYAFQSGARGAPENKPLSCGYARAPGYACVKGVCSHVPHVPPTVVQCGYAFRA